MRIKVLISILAVLIGFIVIYNFYDNNRIVVREARVGIQDLPDSFEGFTILQISDLHQKEFGKDQKRLVEKINSLDYDLIAITGDMVNRVANVEPFYKMLEGIKNKKHVLFIEGNSDPMDYEFGDQIGFRKSDFIKGIEERGVFFLEFPYEIKRGDDSLKVFSIQESGREPERALESIDKELEDKTITGWERTPRLHEREKMLKFKESIAHLKDSDVVIGLTHYPLSPRWFSASYSPDYIRLNYDLVLAGHYHGGQIRVPIYGALYIPEYSLSRHGYLPPQDKVRGLTTVGGVKQYISGGLGATGAVSPLRFRLFNTPELNVIKLTKER